MIGLRTVFAIIPSAETAESMVGAFKALPLSDHPRLVGIYAAPFVVTYGLGADMALAAYIEAQMAAADEERTKAEAAFRKACKAAGVNFEWRTERTGDAVVSAHAGSMARAADVILCVQSANLKSLGRHEIEEVVFASGRPVIGIPANWSVSNLGKRVIIAWDGGREAARAAFDALPILARSEAVRIVSIKGFMSDPVRQFTPGDDIAATLARHGVKVETSLLGSTRESVKDELKAQALDFGADLTVMGCFGHSRLRQRILGGVSRDMLRDLPFPVLLSN